MLVSRGNFVYAFHEKSPYVKDKRSQENAIDVMTANRIVVFLVFVSGVAVAVIGTLLSQYIRSASKGLPGIFSDL